jgi:hypothetical protein
MSSEQDPSKPHRPAEFLDEDDPTPLSPLMKAVARLQHNVALKGEQKGESKEEPTNDNAQLDLFVADLLDYSFKDDMATMDAPLFSLSTRPDMETWRWESSDKKRWLEVMPSANGRATMNDKDLLIYLTSQLVAAMNSAKASGGKAPGRRVRFVVYDFLKTTKRGTDNRSYSLFEDTLDRLQGTRFKTNIPIDKDMDGRKNFGLLESADYIVKTLPNGKTRMIAIEVTVSKWLYRTMELRHVLTISDQYFDLRPMVKRLYELARKHVGEQAEFSMKEETLYEKTSSKGGMREFRRTLKGIIENDEIPDYRFYRDESNPKCVWIKMYQKDAKKYALAYAKQFPQQKK